MADKEEAPVTDPITTPVTPEAPADDWKNDKRLDENGNPLATPVVEEVPVVEPVVEDPPAEGEEEVPAEEANEEAPEKVDFTAPVVKQIETLVEQAGLKASDVAKAVMENGGKLPPDLAIKIVEKHGELVASLVADKLETFHKGAQAQNKERAATIYTQLKDAFKDVTTQSGEQTWKELQTWTKANVPADERTEINSMLAKGGYAAKLAVDTLVSRYKTSNVPTSQAPQLEEGGNAIATGIKPLSRAEYLREFEKLEHAGEVYETSAAFRKLDAQRLAGKKRNI